MIATGTPRLSIVIPAYDEEARLPATLDAWVAFAASQPYAVEILVVDDGSRDGTARVATGAAERHPGLVALERMPRNHGKGAAVRAGMLRAAGEVLLHVDADLNIAPRHVPPALALLERGHDLVVGQRSLRHYAAQERSARRVLAGALVQVTRRTLVLPVIRDTQCGFKAYVRPLAEAVFSRAQVDSFAFDIEALFLARKLGARIAEMPVETEYRAGSTFDVSRHLRPFLRDILAVRLNDLRARYRQPVGAIPGSIRRSG